LVRRDELTINGKSHSRAEIQPLRRSTAPKDGNTNRRGTLAGGTEPPQGWW
jgi:hypothetical protein